jgi:arylsulfatase A-like enzyme
MIEIDVAIRHVILSRRSAAKDLKMRNSGILRSFGVCAPQDDVERFAFVRRFRWLVLILLLIGCAREQPVKPPIILISIDTLRADHLPAYGSKRNKTPAIDRIAADGVLFENAYAHVPLTLPSHATIMLGTLPYQNGVRSNIGYKLPSDVRSSLPKLLAAKGYATGGAVSAYVLRAETGMGALFDFYDDSLEVYEAASLGELQRRGEDTSRAALQWIDTVRGKPFFLFLHLFEPHSPYEPTYDAEIETVDGVIGRFVSELERRGLYEDAIIVLTSDHGEGLGQHGEDEHGVLLYREALHVPLILKLPQKRMAGRRVTAPAQLVDIHPTLTAGTSLIDLAEGRGDSVRTIYSETLYPRLHLGWSELRSLLGDRHHYIESPDPELFDVVTDPMEKENIRESRRRESHVLAAELGKIPLNLEAMAPADPEEMKRLAALGYLSGAGSSSGPRLNPRDHITVLAKVQRTFVLNQEKRYRESAELCREILRDYPDLVDVYNQLAGNLRRLGRSQEALAAYKEAIRRSPQLVDSMAIEVAKLELDLGNLDAAQMNAQQALKLNPAEARLILAGVSMARKEWARAEREARLALDDESRPRVPALILLARILVEQNRLADALASIDRAAARIQQDGAPPVATLASTRGDILARMGRSAEAEAAFRREIETFPTTTDAYLRLSILLASQHRFSEIAPTLEAMVKASPSPRTYHLAAQAMSDLGNEPAAREFRRRAQK